MMGGDGSSEGEGSGHDALTLEAFGGVLLCGCEVLSGD